MSAIITMLVFSTPSVLGQVSESQLSDIPQEQALEATVVEILEEKEIQLNESAEVVQFYQRLKLLVTKGSIKGEEVVVENGNRSIVSVQRYNVGNKVIVMYSQTAEGDNIFQITDYIRRDILLLLFFIFVVCTVAVAKWQGVSSLLGTAFSFLVIFKFILPRILVGADPISTAIIGSVFIIPVSFYLSHGINKKTNIAIAGTVVSLIITGGLAGIFVNAAKLTGYASEEAGFLQVAMQGAVNVNGLLLAGIIIGSLGVLDDITVSQAAVVSQLKEANPRLRHRILYRKAMNVGKDHISSMVNTLVLVYTGAALPLLLLFINNPHPFAEIVNYEIIADEIVRTLVGSIGLILAVPVTTLLASWLVNKGKVELSS